MYYRMHFALIYLLPILHLELYMRLFLQKEIWICSSYPVSVSIQYRSHVQWHIYRPIESSATNVRMYGNVCTF